MGRERQAGRPSSSVRPSVLPSKGQQDEGKSAHLPTCGSSALRQKGKKGWYEHGRNRMLRPATHRTAEAEREAARGRELRIAARLHAAAFRDGDSVGRQGGIISSWLSVVGKKIGARLERRFETPWSLSMQLAKRRCVLAMDGTTRGTQARRIRKLMGDSNFVKDTER
ncbi:hypothetical protein PAHAL_4G068200 [Panicum hallii]|jgi:hypothetical protein|uniref:Uncharacterized protein n=1 Tax=Panicum hallii TaxID=206008 RepID=A0A2T8JC14_9POAL|nr:hypothetical protein PAHAL_4G068200 [Panicum hallii]